MSGAPARSTVFVCGDDTLELRIGLDSAASEVLQVLASALEVDLQMTALTVTDSSGHAVVADSTLSTSSEIYVLTKVPREQARHVERKTALQEKGEVGGAVVGALAAPLLTAATTPEGVAKNKNSTSESGISVTQEEQPSFTDSKTNSSASPYELSVLKDSSNISPSLLSLAQSCLATALASSSAKAASSASSPALSYFQSRTASPLDLVQHTRLALQSLQRLRDAHLSAEQEDRECQDYLAWASNNKHVKYIEADIAVDPARWGKKWAGWKCTILDFAPKPGGGFGAGDDGVYERYPEVWEKVPRGCSMLVLTGPCGPPRRLWIVRANRKFTGHEDESTCGNMSLYTIPGVAPDQVVMTLKENGQVCHVAARHVRLGTAADAPSVTLLGIGSKKVHLAVPYVCREGEAASAAAQRSLELVRAAGAVSPDRYKLVVKMFEAIMPHLQPKIIDFLAEYRLVINSEVILPSSTGPIDNFHLHGNTEAWPMGFSIVANVLHPPRGLELCLDPVFALSLLEYWGWPKVQAFLAPEADCKQLKDDVAKLPEIEGAVVYHLNETGTVQLEKAKAVGYVVIRSLREKAKRLVYGSRHAEGLVSLLALDAGEGAATTSTSSATITAVTASDRKIRARAPSPWKPKLRLFQRKREWCLHAVGIEAMHDYLIGLGGYLDGTLYVFNKKPSLDLLEQQFLTNPRNTDACVARSQADVATRIKQIDHVPMTQAEKDEWITIGTAFVVWIEKGLRSKRFSALDFFNNYSSNFTTFFSEYRQAEANLS